MFFLSFCFKFLVIVVITKELSLDVDQIMID